MELGEAMVAILLCLGAAQGVFYGTILYRNEGGKQKANRLLAIMLFSLSYLLIVQILRLFGIGFYDFWYHVFVDVSWIYGPLIYFYVRALIAADFQWQRKDWAHFIPVVLQVICSVFVRSQSFYWDGSQESLSWLGYWSYVVWMNYSTVYIVASLLIVVYSFYALKRLNKAIRQNAELHMKDSVWLQRVLRSFFAYFSLVLIVLFLDLALYNVLTDHSYFYFRRFYFYPFFIGLSALTYWLGFEGYKRKDQLLFKQRPKLSPEETAQLEAIAIRLRALMSSQRSYTNPKLSLNMLADELDVKPYLLSKCLKLIFCQKFNDYINTLRIEEVKRMMVSPEYQQYTLLSLAFDAGFNSKSSFNRAVMKIEGITPSELKAKL